MTGLGQSTALPPCQALCSSLAELQYLLSSSMGPLGCDKVVETDAKAVLVTNNGIDLLEVLSPKTAMLSMVLQSVKDLVRAHGDGSKRLVLMVCQGLQEAFSHAQGPSTASLASLTRGLSVVQDGYLETVIDEVADGLQLHIDTNVLRRDHLQPTPSHPCSPVVSCSSPCGTQQIISAVLATHMVNKVGASAVLHLAALLAELICRRLRHADPGNSTWDVLQHLALQPPLCLMPGSMVTKSHLASGVVLRQDLASPHMYSLVGRQSQVKFVVLSCALDAADGGIGNASNSAIGVSSQQQLRAAAHAQQHLVRSRLELLASRGVTLLVTTQAATPMLTFLCLEAGIALACGIDEEEARGLCHVADISMTISVGQGVLTAAALGTAAGCYRLDLNRVSTGLVLELPARGAATLMLCAPSEGLCRQYAKLVKSGLTVVARAVTQARCHDGQTRTHHASDSWLALVPGGAAYDAALAVHLEVAVDEVKGRSLSSQHLDTAMQPSATTSHALATLLKRHKPSVLLPALKVLRAMALAVPTGLARTGTHARSRQNCQHAEDDEEPKHVQRSVLLQVHELLAAHRRASHQAGLLHKGCSSSLLSAEALQALQLQQCDVPSTDQPASPLLTVTPIAHHGVLEARRTVTSLWSHAFSLIIQVLRIDDVAAASTAPSHRGIARHDAADNNSRRARQGFAMQSLSDDGASSEDSSDQDTS